MRLRLRHSPPQWLVFSLLLVFTLVGVLLVMKSRGALVTRWMNIYDLSDFPDVGSLLQFLSGLRIPIPPVVSALEITNYLLTRDSYFVANALYRAAMILSFLAAMWMARSSTYRLAGSFVLSVVFLWSTTVIHPGDPQVYDILFPLFILLYVLLLKRALHAGPGSTTYMLVVLSGFFLAMAELTRPFVFFMLPVILFCTYLALRRFPRRVFYFFLIPVVLFSGGWHLHLAVRHQQMTWTNHGGFDLIQAWPMVTRPSLEPEIGADPVKTGRGSNLNTDAHYENSRRLTGTVLKYMATHPLGAARHVLSQAKAFLFDIQTDLKSRTPQSGILSLYRPFVRLSLVWLIVGVLSLVVGVIRSKGQRLALLGVPEHILIIVVVMSIAILSVGASGDGSARFLISLLPFLAALPVYTRNAVATPESVAAQDAETADVNAMDARVVDAQGENWDGLVEGRGRRALVSSVFVIGILFFAAYSGRVGPSIEFDFKNYHYYTGYALLQGRLDVDYAPAQIQTYLNPLSFVPFYLMASHLPPITGGVMMGGIHGVAVGLIFLIAMLIFSSLSAVPRLALSLLCTFAGVYGPVFLSTVGSSHNDVLVSLFVLAGLYALIRAIVVNGAIDCRGARMLLIIGGILVGFAAGLKLACAIYAVACAFAVLATGRGRRGRLVATGMFSAAAFIGLLVTRGFWMVMLWSKFGSPLFPFYNKIFRSPYYYDRNFADVRALPEALGTALLLPFHLLWDSRFTAVSGHIKDARYAVLYVLIAMFGAIYVFRWVRSARRSSEPPAGGESAEPYAAGGSAAWVSPTADSARRAGYFLLTFFVSAYVVWQSMFAIIRYTVPLELLAPVVIVFLIYSIWRGKRWRRAVTVVAFSLVVLMMNQGGTTRGAWRSSYFNLDPPKFDNPEETLIVIANNRPWAFVIPFFQPEVRFVGLWNNFSNRHEEGQRHRATDEMLDLIRSHEGPLYLLSFGGHLDIALQNLEPFGITPRSLICKRIAEDLRVATQAEARRRRAAAAGKKISVKPSPEPHCLFPLAVER